MSVRIASPSSSRALHNVATSTSGCRLITAFAASSSRPYNSNFEQESTRLTNASRSLANIHDTSNA